MNRLFIVGLFLMGMFTHLNAQDFVKIKNRWQKDGKTTYAIHIQHAAVDAGATDPNWWSAQWEMEKVPGTDFYRFKNRWQKDGKTTYYLHNQNGKLEAGAIQPGWWSAQWSLEKVDDTYVRIRNRWKTNEYLNIQGPALASGPVDKNWWSAMWELDGFRGQQTNNQPTTNPQANTDNQPRLMDRPIRGVGMGVVPTPNADLELVRKVKRVTVPAAGIGSAGSSNAPKVLTLDMPPVGSQGNEGSCVAWTTAYAMKSFEMKRKSGLDYVFPGSDKLNPLAVASPEYLFNRINLDDNNCGVGSYFVGSGKNRGALDVLKTEGVTPWVMAPYSSTNGCGSVKNEDEPVHPFAAQNKISNYAEVKDLSPSSLKTMLQDKHPIGFYAFLTDEFMSAGPGYVWKTGEGPGSSAHAMTIIGYDDSRNAYRVQNSWGTNWGDKGYFWLDYDHAQKIIKRAYVTYSDDLNHFEVEVPGYVSVYSEAGYVAWIKLSYTLPSGKKVVIEENLSLFFTFKKPIPVGSVNIELEVGGYAVLDGLDFKKTFNTHNTQACYKIWGTIFDTEYGQVTCSY